MKRSTAPYFYSSHSIHLINRKDTLIRQLHKNWFLSGSLKLKEIINSLDESIELDKLLLVEKFNLKNPKDCFRLISTLRNSKTYPPVMFFGDKSLTSDSCKADALNTYFGSVFNPKINFKILRPDSCKILLDDFDFTVNDVELLLRKCDDSLSSGPDNIPSFVLRQCSTILAPAVYSLFQQVKNSGIWPSEWKHAIITALHKSGSTNDVKNYRPISILCKLSLLFERLLLDFIYPKVKSQISPKQHGFMKHRSTSSQLVHYTQLLYNLLDKNTPCVTVYFDIMKAFDSVPHDRLLEKLTLFGFDEKFLLLFRSYLHGRTQSVKVNSTISAPIAVTSGVPQGSVLGPLFFILFFNDIIDSIHNSDPFLFWDDLKILSSMIATLVQSDIDSLFQWSLTNGLQFHPLKIKRLNFGTNDSLTINGEVIKSTNEMLDLGILISNDLNWSPHVSAKLAKCNQIFNFLRRNVPFNVSINRKKHLYQSLILSILTYCSPAWHPSRTDFKRLENFQRKVLRWIVPGDSYNQCLQRLHILPLCYQLARADLIFLWKVWNKQVDVEFTITKESKPMHTRSHNSCFCLPKTKKFKSQNSFLYRSIKSANELIRSNVLNFDHPLTTFTKSLDLFLHKKLNSFNILNCCSYFVKCFCAVCRS